MLSQGRCEPRLVCRGQERGCQEVSGLEVHAWCLVSGGGATGHHRLSSLSLSLSYCDGPGRALVLWWLSLEPRQAGPVSPHRGWVWKRWGGEGRQWGRRSQPDSSELSVWASRHSPPVPVLLTSCKPSPAWQHSCPLGDQDPGRDLLPAEVTASLLTRAVIRQGRGGQWMGGGSVPTFNTLTCASAPGESFITPSGDEEINFYREPPQSFGIIRK